MRPIRPKKERAKPGQAIQAKWLTRHEMAKLNALIVKAKKEGDLLTWRRAKAVRDYIRGKTVLALVEELDVVRASVNQWIRWCDATGTEALRPRKARGAAPKLTDAQRGAGRADRGGAAGGGVHGGRLDGPADRRPDPEAVRRPLPQSSRSSAAAPARVLGAASA